YPSSLTKDAKCLECILLINIVTFGKPYALIGHVRFDKGEASREVSLLSCSTNVAGWFKKLCGKLCINKIMKML
ncbi:hypothetical protein, partial [Bacillus salipaludis]|uniref:hypothetical protein n=1 Tax=Bacillus salipaludis TaxID=2547811 RepID=UPI001AA014AC